MVVQDDAELLFAGPEHAERAMELLDRSGVRAIRLTAGWAQLAPDARSDTKPEFDATDPGAYREEAWKPIDHAVREARERDMAVIVDIAFWAPVWATDGDATARPRRAIDAEDFAEFARAVTRRYREDVGTFTLWNEPNHPGFLLPQRGAAAVYRNMVAAAYPAVKDEAPDSTVLVGGLAAHGRRNGTPPLRFLRDLACVDARLQPVTTGDCANFKRIEGDGFAHHPYSTRTRPDEVERSASPDDVPMARIGRLIDMLDRLAAAGRVSPKLRSLYITEYAYESNPPDPGARFNPGRAARMMAFGEALAAREPRVRTFAQFIVRDLPATAAGGQQVGSLSDWQSGLLFADRRPKPLAFVLPAPLHAEQVDPQFVRLWGRVRPGRGRRPVRIEAAPPGAPWRTLFQGRTDSRGIVEAERPAPAGTSFRIGRRVNGRWVFGPPVDAL